MEVSLNKLSKFQWNTQKSLLAAKNISALNIIKEYSTHQTPSQWPFEHNWAQAFTNIDLAQASPASTFFFFT